MVAICPTVSKSLAPCWRVKLGLFHGVVCGMGKRPGLLKEQFILQDVVVCVDPVDQVVDGLLQPEVWLKLCYALPLFFARDSIRK